MRGNRSPQRHPQKENANHTRRRNARKRIVFLLTLMLVASMNTAVFAVQPTEDVIATQGSTIAEGQENESGQENQPSLKSGEENQVPPVEKAGFSEANPLTVPEEGLQIENGTLKGIRESWLDAVNPERKTMFIAISVDRKSVV